MTSLSVRKDAFSGVVPVGLLPLALLLTALGCAGELGGTPPEEHAFYYPLSMAASPDQRYAYVVNSNFDQRYRAGWVAVVDLETALAAFDTPGADATTAIIGQVAVPTLGGDIALSADGSLAVVTHRGVVAGGHSALSLLEISSAGDRVSCGDSDAASGLSHSEEQTDCDRAHLLELDPALFDAGLGARALVDPYGARFVTRSDTGDTLLAVSFLGSAAFAVFRLEDRAHTGGAPRLAPLKAFGLGAVGASTVAVHPAPADPQSTLLAVCSAWVDQSSQTSTIYNIDVGRALSEARNYVTGRSVAAVVGGLELYGLTFSPDGARAFVSNRSPTPQPISPDAVVMLDTRFESIEETDPRDGSVRRIQRPRYAVLDAVPVGEQPSGIVYLSRGLGPDLLAVASFHEDSLYVLAIGSETLSPMVRLDGVGQGPFALRHVTVSGRELILATTFYDHGLALIDVTSADPGDFRVLGQIRNKKVPVSERRQ